ncbi:MAG: hypothetical protein U9P14_03035, partial [Gemmatimonadota bacterium]|nr:hypothetical protein [Gemmatimonadota bacterium]
TETRQYLLLDKGEKNGFSREREHVYSHGRALRQESQVDSPVEPGNDCLGRRATQPGFLQCRC